MSRGKLYNRTVTHQKYVSRLKERMYKWYVKDESLVTKDKWRLPHTYQELDDGSPFVKELKDTPTPYKDYWDKMDTKKEIKKLRRESKKTIKDELDDGENEKNIPENLDF